MEHLPVKFRSIRLRNERAASLVELMSVVAILGFLTSLSMTAYSTFTIKAKRVEVYTNISVITKLIESHKVSNEGYMGYGFTDSTGYASRASLGPTERANFGIELSSDDVSSGTSCRTPNIYGFTITNCKKANYKYRILFKSLGVGPASTSDGTWGIEAPSTKNLCGRGIANQERWAYCPGTSSFCAQWDVLKVPGGCEYGGGPPSAPYVTDCNYLTCFGAP